MKSFLTTVTISTWMFIHIFEEKYVCILIIRLSQNIQRLNDNNIYNHEIYR